MRTRSRGVSICAGPNHAATPAGSVHAAKTCSRGAAKTRVIRTCWAAAVDSLISLSLSPQMLVEPVHPRLPRPGAGLHPRDGVVERVGLHPARPPLRGAAAHDEPRPLEHLQVPRDGREAHRQRLGELADRRLALGEAGQDRAARRIGERGEREAELVGRHFTDRLNNGSVNYHTTPPGRNPPVRGLPQPVAPAATRRPRSVAARRGGRSCVAIPVAAVRPSAPKYPSIAGRGTKPTKRSPGAAS